MQPCVLALCRAHSHGDVPLYADVRWCTASYAAPLPLGPICQALKLKRVLKRDATELAVTTTISHPSIVQVRSPGKGGAGRWRAVPRSRAAGWVLRLLGWAEALG